MGRKVNHLTTLPHQIVSLTLAVVLFVGQTSLVVAAGATLGFSPASDTVTEGETFAIRLVVNTGGQAINAAEATIDFPKDRLDVKSVSKSGSIFTLWPIEPSASNATGTVTFSGGVPNPGFTGSSGRIITLNFLAQKPGSAKLTIGNAQLLANDGKGTNILGSVGSATITIKEKPATPAQAKPEEEPPPAPSLVAPRITSTTHPDPDRWYPTRDVNASWSAGEGVTGYNAVFDQSPSTVPPKTSEGLGSALSRTVRADGVWYAHVRARYREGWSATSHYAFRIDTTPPAPFNLVVDHPDPAASEASVSFETTDEGSGVDRYELQLDDAAFAPATSPAKLTGLAAGTRTVRVKAIDKAGNLTEASATLSVTEAVPAPVTLVAAKRTVEKGQPTQPTVAKGKPLRLQGYAKLDETVRIVVRSEESVFEFPVSEIIDPNPVQPAPPGYGAWKVEIKPNLSPGEHEVKVQTKDETGTITSEAPTIKFQVVTDVVQLGQTFIPYWLVALVLLILVALLIPVVLIMIVKYRRLHQRIETTANRKRKTRIDRRST